jgi:hypothetical protein
MSDRKSPRFDHKDLFTLLGMLLFGIGLWSIYHPLALLFAGICFLAIAGHKK